MKTKIDGYIKEKECYQDHWWKRNCHKNFNAIKIIAKRKYCRDDVEGITYCDIYYMVERQDGTQKEVEESDIFFKE